MRTLVLIVEAADDNRCALPLEKLGRVRTYSGGRLIVEDGDDWLAISNDSSLIDDFDEDEMRKISSVVSSPKFFLLECRGDRLLNALAMHLDPTCRMLVDNDHGLIIGVEELQRRARISSEWLTQTS